MLKTFGGDYRVFRVCMASENPLETLHKIRTGQYSIITFLECLEFLDVKETMMENEIKNASKNKDFKT